MPTIDAVRSWSDYVRRHHCRNTQLIYIPIIWRFQPYMPEFMSELTCEHIENYLSTLKTKNRTINNHLITIKSFGHWCSDHGIPNPASKVKKLPEDHPKQRVLSEDEYAKVLAICKTKRERCIIQLLGTTGLRANELISLRQGNLDPDNKFLHIIGKGNKPRTIPLCKVAQEAIDDYFNLPKSLTYITLYRLCKCLAHRAAISSFSPHALRHFFATRLMRNGVNLYRISKILGHSSVTTTEQIYIHFLATIDLAGITDCLNK